MRQLRYRAISEDLRRRVEAGEFGAGRLLPSESELSAAYEASRVTVRKALDELRTLGLAEARQGFGWFVPADPFRQTLGRLGTIEAQLAESGLRPERRVLEFGFIAAPRRARELFDSRRVLRVRRVNLADGEPFARVTVWVPEVLARGLSLDQVEAHPFQDLLDVRFGTATQTIGAAGADERDAELLEVPVGSPVLRCERVTFSADGEAVLLAEHVFPGHRTEFVVDLTGGEAGSASIAPSGLRLVD